MGLNVERHLGEKVSGRFVDEQYFIGGRLASTLDDSTMDGGADSDEPSPGEENVSASHLLLAGAAKDDHERTLSQVTHNRAASSPRQSAA